MAFSSLGRLLDIEWMLARDEARPAAEVARHDRELVRERAASDPEQALEVWLDGRRRELDGRTLGIRFSEALTVLHALLVVVALGAGAGTAEALLASASTREPTNVLHFSFATLAWPLVLLLGSVLAFAVSGRLGRSLLLTDLYAALLALAGRWGRSRVGDDWELIAEWRKLRRSARRYRDIEVATLTSAAQWYPLCFHLGAAASLLGSALFSDLAFAWSTTNDSLAWQTLARAFDVLTAPWCVPLDLGCVDEELVRATQFSRFSGGYALSEGAARSGAWWPALFGCLLVYGVLPRLLFALGLRGFAAIRARRASERVLELRARLFAPLEVVARRAGAGADGAVPAPAASEPERGAPRSGECWLVTWRGAEIEESDGAVCCARLGLRVVRREAAGGSDFGHDRELLEAARGSSAAMVVVVEGWEAPDKATRRFVESLRRSGDPARPVFVSVLVPAADAPELGLWRDRMRLLEDPFVSVEPCIPRALSPRAVSETSP